MPKDDASRGGSQPPSGVAVDEVFTRQSTPPPLDQSRPATPPLQNHVGVEGGLGPPKRGTGELQIANPRSKDSLEAQVQTNRHTRARSDADQSLAGSSPGDATSYAAAPPPPHESSRARGRGCRRWTSQGSVEGKQEAPSEDREKHQAPPTVASGSQQGILLRITQRGSPRDTKSPPSLHRRGPA